MIGLGLDLCEIKRIERTMEKNDSFLTRYYTDEERSYIAAKGKMGAASAAAMFAAKEAFLKAVGLGLGGGIPLCDIGVSHDEHGAPRYDLRGAAALKLAELSANTAMLSLTHEAGIAGAVCIIE